jgi:F0F1-type ATP synthase assembly protein I
MSTVLPSVAADAPVAVVAPAAALPAVPPPRCDNCGSALLGKYCAQCGQKVEPPLHSVWHFMQVATEDITHADSRIWRTLWALLAKPGYLTREFFVGHRARYLPPLRLYLVLSVAFFLYASSSAHKLQVLKIGEDNHGRVAHVQAAPRADPDEDSTDQHPNESPAQHAERVCGSGGYNGPWAQQLKPVMHDACVRSMLDHGRSVSEAFLHNLPRAMFLFLPLLAALMMTLYWFPRRYYVEHLLLFVHNHAFVFLAIGLTWALDALLPFLTHALPTIMFCYIAWYMFRSMRVVYGQGRWLTFGKLTLLSFFYLVCGGIMLAATSVFAFLMQ